MTHAAGGVPVRALGQSLLRALNPALGAPDRLDTFLRVAPRGGVNARYLFHWLRSDAFIESLLALQRGSSYPAVGDADVLGRSIPLPPSREQARIAENLDEFLGGLQDGVRELRAAKRTLVLYRESLLTSAVDGSLTVDWRRRHLSDLEPVQFEPVGVSGTLPKLPASQNGLYLPSERYGDGLPILRINDYQVNFVPERSALRCVRNRHCWAERCHRPRPCHGHRPTPKNILRAAFSGRLVPQDPNDEPASVLLDRIRASREAIAVAKPRARRRTAARLAG